MSIVIIGAGPAGITVAETIRRHDSRVPITMISEEPFAPYSPPALADYFLTGREETLFWKGHDICERLDVRYISGKSARSVHPQKKTVYLDDGTAVPYDQLVIAAGARLYAPVDGYDMPGVYNFKSLSAARALQRRVEEGARTALIVGAGFIGVEVAILLREMGLSVRMLDRSRVLGAMLDPETSEIVRGVLQEQGIDLLLGPEYEAVAIVGDGYARGVQVRSGEVIKADLLIAATGVKPNVEFLENSGIAVNWGILVDDYLRTNVPDIYAAGDIAETVDRMTGERYVHAIFPNAVAQGQIAAYNVLGFNVAYEGAERMNSLAHLGLPLMAVGEMDGDEEIRWRRGRTLRKIFLRNGRIVGFRLFNDLKAAGVYRSLLMTRTDVRPFRDRLLTTTLGIADVVLSAAGASG